MESRDQENRPETDQREMYVSPLTILLFLGLLMIFGTLLGQGVIYLVGKGFGYSLNEVVESLNAESGIRVRNFIRINLMINHTILFILPPLFLSYLFFKKRWYIFLGWEKIKPESFSINAVAGSFLLLFSLPLVQFLYVWNKNLPLPDWARTIEDSTSNMIQNLLVTEASWELFFNVLVIAIIPAVGEEMVFRGVIQKRLAKWFGKPELAIWIAAILFSAFHLQLEGFFSEALIRCHSGLFVLLVKKPLDTHNRALCE